MNGETISRLSSIGRIHASKTPHAVADQILPVPLHRSITARQHKSRQHEECAYGQITAANDFMQPAGNAAAQPSSNM